MDMKKLLEAVTKFAGEPEQKPGEQWRGTDKGTPGTKLVGDSKDPSILKDLSKGPTPKTREQELAEEWANFNEDDLGVEPKRPHRKGTRADKIGVRGHKEQPRYTTVKADEGWESGPEERSGRERDPDAEYDAARQEKADASAQAAQAKRPQTKIYTLTGRGPNMEPNYKFPGEYDSQEAAIAAREKLMADPKTPNPRMIGISTQTKYLDEGLYEAGDRAGALNTAIQLKRTLANSQGKPAHEIDLLNRQLNHLMRKYSIKPEELNASSDTPPPPPGGNQQQSSGGRQQPPPPPGGQQAGNRSGAQGQQSNYWDPMWNREWAAKQQAEFRKNNPSPQAPNALDPNWLNQHMAASNKAMQDNQASLNAMMQNNMASGPWNMPPKAKMAEGWGGSGDRVHLPDEPATYYHGTGQLYKEYQKLYDELVPTSGAADTIEGEVLRAASKIVYRHYNDGDEFNEASFSQLEPYIGRVTSYDDLAHKATVFALAAEGEYHPNTGWDCLDVMEYGPDFDDEDDGYDDYYDDNPDWDQDEDDLEEVVDPELIKSAGVGLATGLAVPAVSQLGYKAAEKFDNWLEKRKSKKKVKEFVENPRGGDEGGKVSRIVQIVDKLLKAGNTVDCMVIGACGHVERADLTTDGFTPNGSLQIRKIGTKPSKQGARGIRPFKASDDANYDIQMVGPKHYKIVDKMEDRTDGHDELDEAAADRVYTVDMTKYSYNGEARTRSTSGTIPELLDYFGYTLEVGKSYERERGRYKINMQPKNIKSLVDTLNKAASNGARNGAASTHYSVGGEPQITESIESTDPIEGAILSAVQELIQQGHTEVAPEVITNMVVAATSQPFLLKDLVDANKNSPAIQHYVDSINPSKVKFSSDILTVKNENPAKTQAQAKAKAQSGVSSMAARAANRSRLGESKVVPVITAFRKGMEKIAASNASNAEKQAAFDKLSAEFHKNAQAYSDTIKAKKAKSVDEDMAPPQAGSQTPTQNGQDTASGIVTTTTSTDPKVKQQVQQTMQGLNALKSATQSSAPAQKVAQALNTATQGGPINTIDSKTLEPMMDVIAQAAKNPSIANQFKNVAQQAGMAQKKEQTTQQQQK